MKKKIILLIFLMTIFSISTKTVYAYSASDYEQKNLCGNFEVDGMHSDGVMVQVGCFGSYEEAKNFMVNNGADDLVIFTKVGWKTKIIDANVALLDLSVNPETLTYFYGNSDLRGSSYTYMDTGSLYGGVDGAHIESAYSNARGEWTAKVRIGNYTGWINQDAYEIVPITWVKSKSSYTVTDNSIRHNYVAKIQNDYYGGAGNTIGPKPEMLSKGEYYSYDGHYFYTDLVSLIKDYKNGNYNQSVNKDNPYYNYYMYLSNHTKTTYSSINIDEYIRNNMGIQEDIYGNATANGSSRLYGSGTYFYYAQQKHGVNALLSLSLSRNETGNGRSSLAAQKNNGFGLNAVDSNPYNGATWYATYASSILGYASKWVTDGFAHPRDWRYFGPQFGDKFIGMNVKYASDTYWSEKMAANYYSFDMAKGFQDYNYYQLGVNTRWGSPTYSAPNTNSREIYKYPEPEDAMVIVGEVTGSFVEGSNKWYEIVSDLNIDNNFNEIHGDYNWNRTVYIPASYVRKINNGKNGYISPNSVTDYQDSEYHYDLLVENAEFKPKVGLSTKTTEFYYDPSMQAKTGKSLRNNRYVIIYSIAYDKYNNPVSYLVTSDYWHSQKHWVKEDSITIVNKAYGKENVTVSGNQYSWVNSTTIDSKSTLISGLYTNSYVPILEEREVDGALWYKVPVDISGTTNEFGWTLAQDSGVKIDVYGSIYQNSFPTITASNKTIIEGTEINILDGVNANDIEDGNITNKVKIRENNLNNQVPGEYRIVYEVTDSANQTVTKEIKVIVVENQAPIIQASDLKLREQTNFNPLQGVTATDREDGDLTSKLKVINNSVDTNTPGEYKVIYEVEDNFHKKTTKEIKVIVVENQAPVIQAKDITIIEKTSFNPMKGVIATDEEDGNITNNIKIVNSTVDINTPGEYRVIYQVSDSNNKTVTKEIKVIVIKKKEDTTSLSNITEEELKALLDSTTDDGEFYLDALEWDKEIKKFIISGYLTILNQNNDIHKEYGLLLKNKATDNISIIPIDSWLENTPYEITSDDGNLNYQYSWFKGKIDFSDISNGDYELFMVATEENHTTVQLVDNLFNQKIDRRGEDDLHGYNFKVDLSLKSKKVELSIRDELYTTSTAPTFRNMINDYENIFFSFNRVHFTGTSYNYGGTYSSISDIKRVLIVEDTTTFKQYYYDLSSTNKGSYEVVCTDNLDKSFSWYDKEVDLSNLPKGKYSLSIYTKTKDAIDYGELTDSFRTFDEIKGFINSKEYIITINKERNNRLELMVK